MQSYGRDGKPRPSEPVNVSRSPTIPDSSGPSGGTNGSQQGLLMRKLAVSAREELAIVNSSFKANERSRVWVIRARLAKWPTNPALMIACMETET